MKVKLDKNKPSHSKPKVTKRNVNFKKKKTKVPKSQKLSKKTSFNKSSSKSSKAVSELDMSNEQGKFSNGEKKCPTKKTPTATTKSPKLKETKKSSSKMNLSVNTALQSTVGLEKFKRKKRKKNKKVPAESVMKPVASLNSSLKVEQWIELNSQNETVETASKSKKPKLLERNDLASTPSQLPNCARSTEKFNPEKQQNSSNIAVTPTSKNQISKKKSKKLQEITNVTAEPAEPNLSTVKLPNLPNHNLNTDSPTVAKAKREKFKNSKESTLRERMMSRLSAARFRFINEELYTWDGQKSSDLGFAKDPKMFEAYHSGFRQQAKLWPINPIDIIIKSIKRLPNFEKKIVADFGCGEAKLAEELCNNKVYSFDLVALNDRVTVADNANTNLYSNSVDIAVHCLSLMSSNISSYIREANRVLKVGGILKISEVESRFEDVDKFIDGVSKFNFRLTQKDLSKNLFYFLDFEKTSDIGVARKRKLPALSLLPCLYKKR